MHLSYINKPISIKRLPQFVDRTRDIISFDSDNLYPQRTMEIAARSGIASSCIETLAEFTDGEGFENDDYGLSVINDDAETVNKVMKQVVADHAMHNGFGLHFDWNLNLQISAVRLIDFEFLRFGLQRDQDGNFFVDSIKFSNNWEMDILKTGSHSLNIKTFDLFSSDPEVISQQITAAGGIQNWNGQIMYVTPKKFRYPLSTFDAVAESVQATGEIQVYELSNIQNSFHADLIFRYRGKFESNDKKREVQEALNPWKGARGAGFIIIEDESDFEGKLTERIDRNNNDKAYDSTHQKTRDRVLERYAIPKELVGVRSQSPFSKEEYQDAFDVYNVKIKGRRETISEVFKLWTPFFKETINTDDNYAITPQQFGLASDEVNDDSPKPEVVEEPEQVED